MRGEVGEVLIQQSDVLSCVPMYNVHNQPVLLAERLVLQEECKVHASVFLLILWNLMRLFLFPCSGRDHLCWVFFFYNPVQCCLSPGHDLRKWFAFVISLSEANITLKNMNLQKVQGVRFVQLYLKRKLKKTHLDMMKIQQQQKSPWGLIRTHVGVSNKQVTLCLFSLSAAQCSKIFPATEMIFHRWRHRKCRMKCKTNINTTSIIHLNCICLCLYFPSGWFFFWSVMEMCEPHIILRLAVAYRRDFVESLLIQWRLNGRQKDRGELSSIPAQPHWPLSLDW